MGDHRQRVALGRIEGVANGKIFAERHVPPLIRGADTIRRAFANLQSIGLTRDFKILQRMAGSKLNRNGELGGRLRAIRIGPERQCKKRLELLYEQALLVFQLHPLGAVRRDGNDLATEHGGAASFIGIAFAGLQKTGVDGLRFGHGVDFFSALALQDDARNAGHVVPDCKVGNQGAIRQGKRV